MGKKKLLKVFVTENQKTFRLIKEENTLRMTASKTEKYSKDALRKKRPYLEFFWSAFSRILTEYRNLLCKSRYSVQM